MWRDTTTWCTLHQESVDGELLVLSQYNKSTRVKWPVKAVIRVRRYIALRLGSQAKVICLTCPRWSEMTWAGVLSSGAGLRVTCRLLTLEALQQLLGLRSVTLRWNRKWWSNLTGMWMCSTDWTAAWPLPSDIVFCRCDSLCARWTDTVFSTWTTGQSPGLWWQDLALLCWKYWSHLYDKSLTLTRCQTIFYILQCKHFHSRLIHNVK